MKPLSDYDAEAIRRALTTLAASGAAVIVVTSERPADDPTDPFVAAMAEKLPAEGFEGTAAELLRRVTPDENTKWWRAPKEWPRDARQATAHLRRVAPVMRATGWTVDDLGTGNHHKVVRWRIVPPG